ncbi:MAG: FtsX-like permease family protein, partial [Phycisphaerales bacterium]|nr:FtsX-like permease family protein [Phycisphaerales bacterium]
MTCLAVGVCAVVAVSAMVAALRAGTAERSRELLGADLQVKSRQPLPAELDRLVADLEGAERSDLVELPTMVAAPTGAARLVQIVAVSGRWPLFGRLGCEPADAPLFLGRGVAVEAAGLRDLGLEVGDEILVGGRPFPIVARVLEAPEKSGFAFMLGPRIFMGRGALDETGLLAFGSRLEYKALIRLGATDASRARDLAERWRDALPGAEYLDIRSHDAAEERIARPIEQAESYLGLVALLSLVLGGIGVARIVQTWIESRQRGIAVMRCLGMRPIEVALVYLGQIMLLALLASLVGAAIGLCAPAVLRVLLADFLPGGDLPVWQPVALVDGLLLGLAMALLFSVPALAALWRVSPARAFRTGAEPLPAPRFLGLACWATVALGLWVAAWRRSGSGSLALAFVFLLGLATALLALAAWVLRRVLALLPRDRLPLALRHGLAALLRPASGLRAALVAIGLGSLVVSTIFLVQDRLAQGIAQAIP